MITAENITDEQIREMRRTSPTSNPTLALCDEALRGSRYARARCAAILNERAERAKENK